MKTQTKKIVINKSDEVALVVEKIIDSNAKEMVLNIPRFSKLADSLANFHLIKRESKLLDKKIVIESVDDKVIELAGLSGLNSVNPILARSRRQFSDIVSGRVEKQDDNAPVRRKKIAEIIDRKYELPRERKWAVKNVLIIGGVIAFAAFSLFLAISVLPRAEVKVITQKTPWNYKDSIVADKNGKVPVQIFSQQKNFQFSFPASGHKTIEKKATGKITVYNAYSSEPQPLVATTRFVTPDGKIFRLTQKLIIPGAKIVGGKVIPSIIEATVAADKSGADYNIGPVNYFSVPGFEGTPKYQGFYAESKEAMTGGFIGQVPFPTDDDARKAKAEAISEADAALRSQIAIQISGDFKVIEGAANFSIIRQSVITDVDNAGNFSVIIDAAMKLAAFREKDILTLLAAKVEKEMGAGYQFSAFDLSYGVGRFDSKTGVMSFPVDFKGSVAKYPDLKILKEQILGKTDAELRSLIFALSDIETAQISLWPFWVGRVPNAESRVKITVE